MPLYQPTTHLHPPPILHIMPAGRYGISYDLFTNKIKFTPPEGWDSWPSSVYRRLIKRLQNCHYERAQYSVFQSTGFKSALAAWHDMLALRSLPPRGLIPSVVRRLQIYYVQNNIVYGTERIQLGGEDSPGLIGPTPAALVPQQMPSDLGTAYGNNFRVPEGVRPGVGHEPGRWKCPPI